MSINDDPVTREIIRNLLNDVSNEMQSLVLHSSYSPLWQEGGDFSCAVLTSGAEIIAQNDRVIPIHVSTMIRSVSAALDRFGGRKELENGDIVIQNDPYAGNNHLNDVLLFKPAFVDGRLIGIAASRGHWVDIGGAKPASATTDNYELLTEGLIIPPGKLFEAGKRNQALYDIILANVRGKKEREGDFNAQLAGVRRGADRLVEIAEKYGVGTVTDTMDFILDQEEQKMRDIIQTLPDGEYVAQDYMDGDGIEDNLTKICATLSVESDEIHVDFSGTDNQFKGGANAPLAVTFASTFYALKVALDPGEPESSGGFRPITVTAPTGTVVNPTYPAPVVRGNADTGTRILDVVIAALAKIDPELAFSAGEGCTPGLWFHSLENGQMNRLRAPGGMGASPNRDGVNAIRCGVGNTAIQSFERVEEDFDFVLTKAMGIAQNTGGAGQYRGGNSSYRIIQFDHEVEFFLTLDRAKTQPYGLADGLPGSSSTFYYTTPDGERHEFASSKDTVILPAGTEVFIQSPGGGGYGNPASRLPERVIADIENGYISTELAQEKYGFAVDAFQLG